MRRAAVLVPLLAVLAVAPAAHGQEAPSSESVNRPFRIGAAGTIGYASVHRSTSDPTSEGAYAIGAELRVHPYSQHGVVLAYTYAEGIFGPHVSIVDAAYSIRLIGGKPLHGATGALYVDMGPSIGFVSHAPPGPDHTVLGGRVSLAADVQLWNITIGPVASYRGGLPLGGPPDGWEGALTVFLRAGVVLDLDR
jgi:hypothetical protein